MSLEARILVVDDDPSQRELLAGCLRDMGAEVVEAADGRQALVELETGAFDLLLTDQRMPGIDGHELLRRVRALDPGIGVILVTAYGTVEQAVACLKDGAADYLLKPVDLDELEIVIARRLEEVQLQRENRQLRQRLGEIESIPGIITAGGPMAEVLSTAARAAPAEVPVLLLGESGTGKEVLARAIHQASGRSGGPFVAVNAAALSPTLLESELFGHEKGAFTGADRQRIGRFEAAAGGTLFLDEVGELAPEIQVKLLRVLQEKEIERVGSSRPLPVDVRLIAATNSDVVRAVREGAFREDFYYRLAVVTIELPPLRCRRADIPLLVDHFLERYAPAGQPPRRLSREAMSALVRYDFPGNVRELENIIQRALVLARGSQITTADLPPTVAAAAPAIDEVEGGTLPERVAALERRAIEQALAETEGNQSRAAALLGISERALRYKLGKFREREG